MILLPTTYFGNIEYYRYLLSGDSVAIEVCEHFPKQTYRNRAMIMSANGVIPLIVPLRRSRGGKRFTSDIAIDYSMEWQRNSWRAIVAAYRGSPYFEHFEGDIYRHFSQRYDTLLELNSDILNTTLNIMGKSVDISYSMEYVKGGEFTDCRELFSPRRISDAGFNSYYQVFSDRLPFAENLSILDLIFCEGGTSSLDYILL